jgi:hypothetical protein
MFIGYGESVARTATSLSGDWSTFPSAVITLASAALARIRDMPSMQAEYLKLRERSYGLSWNQAEALLEKGSRRTRWVNRQMD